MTVGLSLSQCFSEAIAMNWFAAFPTMRRWQNPIFWKLLPARMSNCPCPARNLRHKVVEAFGDGSINAYCLQENYLEIDLDSEPANDPDGLGFTA